MQTEKGRYIPVDPEPVFVIEGGGDGRFYTAEEGVLTGTWQDRRKYRPKKPRAIRRWGLCRIGGPALVREDSGGKESETVEKVKYTKIEVGQAQRGPRESPAKRVLWGEEKQGSV